MFLGAYWPERKESREQVAQRLERFLSSIAANSGHLSEWFMKGRSSRAARTPLKLEAASLGAMLKVNRRDVGGDVIPELGFSLGVWNGASASLDATLGISSPHVKTRLFCLSPGRRKTSHARTGRPFLRLRCVRRARICGGHEHGVSDEAQCDEPLGGGLAYIQARRSGSGTSFRVSLRHRRECHLLWHRQRGCQIFRVRARGLRFILGCVPRSRLRIARAPCSIVGLVRPSSSWRCGWPSIAA